MIEKLYKEDELEKVLLINQDNIRQELFFRDYHLEQEIHKTCQINALAYIQNEIIYLMQENELKQMISFSLLLKSKKDYEAFIQLVKTKGVIVENEGVSKIELIDFMASKVQIVNNYFFYAKTLDKAQEVPTNTNLMQDVFKTINNLTQENLLPEQPTTTINLEVKIRGEKTWESIIVGYYEKSL